MNDLNHVYMNKLIISMNKIIKCIYFVMYQLQYEQMLTKNYVLNEYS